LYFANPVTATNQVGMLVAVLGVFCYNLAKSAAHPPKPPKHKLGSVGVNPALFAPRSEWEGSTGGSASHMSLRSVREEDEIERLSSYA
jgi:hypothetical protein